ncbi:FAD-dependent oxidoreductase [Embleya sp. NBC_00896]|uniref:FAD-dependent oxidoreductase n=1 Tax=Embleya sp. NBC_00896 TaxID=2975961 RepID=UPI002F91AC9B|nr:FAD/NAD(P)-binding protein [Embleya sp. NBC_00896]
MNVAYDVDMVVVGAGPAGVAAALLAASLTMRTVVVEADQIGGKLHTIGALDNVSGNWTNGPQLASALTKDLTRLERTGLCSVVRARALGVSSHDDRAELTLEDGRMLVAQAVVVATGVTSLTPADAGWVNAPTGFFAPPLWRTAPDQLAKQVYVLGGDRPLGTWLRAHPNVAATLHVLCPPADDYKVAEVAEDSRVRIVPVSSVALSPMAYGEGWVLEAMDRRGEPRSYAAATVLGNLGNKPATLGGLTPGADGYCPPGIQHPRVRIAGDLRSAGYQRIATAQGSGAEAVLGYYYATQM